jgi:hypothetical protein
MQKMHSGLKANLSLSPRPQRAISALRPGNIFCMQAAPPVCKFRLLASRQFSHPGDLRAIIASLENANFARLLRAEFARDSFNYLRVFF